MDRPKIERGELRKIYEQAALWMLLKKEADLTQAEQRRYERWLKLPYRAEALKEMEALSQRLDVPWRRRRLALRLAACRQAPLSLPG